MDANESPLAELTLRSEIKQGVYILRLSGDVTKSSGDFLLQWQNWESGLPEGISALLVDFSGVTYINSAGIAALIRLFRIGSTGLYRCGCFNLHYHYEKLFSMVGLDKYLKLYPSEWAAIDQIKSGSV